MAEQLRVFLTGGISNTDIALSLGGAASSTEMAFQGWDSDQPTVPTWLEIDLAFGMTSGTDSLNFYQIKHEDDVLELHNQPNDDDPTGAYLIDSIDTGGVDGHYTLNGENPGSGINVEYISANINNDYWKFWFSYDTVPNLFSNLSVTDSRDGKECYRCVVIQNLDAADATYELFAGTNNVSTYAMGFDPAGKNSTPTSIASETDVPTGVVFQAPTEIVPLSVVLSQNDYIGVWFRQTLAAGNEQSGLPDIYLARGKET